MKRPTLLLAIIALSAAGIAKTQAQELRGEQVVKLQCVKCHAAGVSGAPKIGDREAWIPRMKQGVDTLVRSAIRGHGNMPARGGMAQLTDPEVRAAVLYMFNGRDAAPATGGKPAAAARDPHRKVVEGIEIDLGVVSKSAGLYHVNVSLQDATTRAAVKGATVDARVANALTGQSKKLEPTEVNGMTGYGGDFRMPGNDPYVVTVQVKLSGRAQPIEASFDYKR
jgi:cytochrome c5